VMMIHVAALCMRYQPENGGSIVVRNVCTLSHHYTVS